MTLVTEPKFEERVGPLSLIALYVFLTLLIYLIAVYRRGKLREEDNERLGRSRASIAEKSRTVLLVISHPDDECMFFSPSILALNSSLHTSVHILCLSNGDYYGQGELRGKELILSCAILGIPSCNVTVLNESELPDDPKALWDEELVSKLVLHQIVKCDAQIVLTFDKHGVSSHPNHIAAYKGIRKLVVQRQLPSGVRAFCLESIGIVRKYCSFLEVPISFILCAIRGNKVLVSSPYGVLRAQRAMRAHASQFVWFRVLNMFFSRYFIINTIRSLKIKEDS
ncbi:N-acetylglucosaminyl-phosphatidylinositol de-N-acetylase-like [Lytechinus pictus]|uniref:N-acetylglucosaminyl-phosphatidylinositol de-N-acetylase-like n=1 Tax=Lytechinus pictus TaxID=7653 RepID=UPI00240D4A89|nr:N-acetylglucosaminyl-phosphatidylinositol de-N-acetylase-like [Lytechinus pictus]